MRKLCRETVWGIGPSHKDLPRLCLAEPHHKQTIHPMDMRLGDKLYVAWGWSS